MDGGIGMPNIPTFSILSSAEVRVVLYGAFTLDVKLVLNENLGGILGGTQF